MSQRVHCPKCKSTDIAEKNEAYTELRVLSWDVDESKGITPSDYDTDNDPEWSAIDGPNPYVCKSCDWSGDLDELVAGDVLDEDDEEGD